MLGIIVIMLDTIVIMLGIIVIMLDTIVIMLSIIVIMLGIITIVLDIMIIIQINSIISLKSTNEGEIHIASKSS